MLKKSTPLFKLILLSIVMLAVLMPSVFAANELTNSINNYTSEMFKQRAMANTSKSDANANNFVTQNYQTASLHALGDEVTINRFEIGYFCLNKGNDFSPGAYNVYHTGNIRDLKLKYFPTDRHILSFVAGEEKLAADSASITGYGNRTTQPWAHFIWVNLGVNKEGSNPDPSKYAGMLAKYNAYNKIRNDVVLSNTNPLDIIPVDPAGNDIATTEITPVNDQNGQLTSNGVWVANDQGQLRVKIEYPWDEKLNTGYDEYPDPDHYLDMVKIKISLNGTVIYSSHEADVENKLTDGAGNPFKIGDKEAYLPVEMVEYGTNVKFKVEWSFRKYEDGQYEKLTPYHKLFQILDCGDSYSCSGNLYIRLECVAYRIKLYNATEDEIKGTEFGDLRDWSSYGKKKPEYTIAHIAGGIEGSYLSTQQLESGITECFTVESNDSYNYKIKHYIYTYNEEEEKWERSDGHIHDKNDFSDLVYMHILEENGVEIRIKSSIL